MKRGGPLQRKTPLRNKASMKRGTASGFSGPWPSRSKPIKVKRDQPRRRSRDQLSHGMPWQDVRMIIYTRSLGRCEGCGTGLNLAGMEAHHRRTRRLGPDCPCNALALCPSCHHGPLGHGGPEAAREVGRIISRHDEVEPSEVPVTLHGYGKPVYLTCGGTYLAAA